MDANADLALQDELYPELDDRIGVGVIVITIAFFFVVNAVILRLSQRVVTLKMTSQWRWRNLAVSWVHADICALGIWYCYAHYRHRIQVLTDMIDLRPYPAYILLAFSTGYFLYDFLDHILQGQSMKQWEVTLHHIAVLFIFGYNLLFHTSVAFSVLALIVEINSVFLHFRKLLQMVQLPFSHWLYRTTVALNLVTFVFFRGAAMVLIWAGLLYSRHKVSVVYFVALGLVMVFMIVLNPVLFWRLLRSDVLRGRRKTRVQQKEADGHVVQNGDPTGTATAAARISENVSRGLGCQSDGTCCKSKTS